MEARDTVPAKNLSLTGAMTLSMTMQQQNHFGLSWIGTSCLCAQDAERELAALRAPPLPHRGEGYALVWELSLDGRYVRQLIAACVRRILAGHRYRLFAACLLVPAVNWAPLSRSKEQGHIIDVAAAVYGSTLYCRK